MVFIYCLLYDQPCHNKWTARSKNVCCSISKLTCGVFMWLAHNVNNIFERYQARLTMTVHPGILLSVRKSGIPNGISESLPAVQSQNSAERIIFVEPNSL